MSMQEQISNAATPDLHGESPPHEAEMNAHFTSERVVNRDTYEELKWNFLLSLSGRAATVCGIGTLCCLLILFWSAFMFLRSLFSLSYENYVILYIAIFLVAFFGVFLFRFWAKRCVKKLIDMLMQRAQESLGTTEQIISSSFLDDKVRIHNLSTEAKIHINYDAFLKFEETKNMYVLCTRTGQLVFVSKVSLVSEQENEDFILFIDCKCKNIKWRT